MKFTVYFDGAFWVGLIEYYEDSGFKVFQYPFGKEPNEEDILKFIDHQLIILMNKYKNIETSIDNVKKHSKKKVNPKRMQREISKAKKKPVLSTKSQEAMKEIQQDMKLERKKRRKEYYKELKEKKFRLKQKKRREKKKGH